MNIRVKNDYCLEDKQEENKAYLMFYITYASIIQELCTEGNHGLLDYSCKIKLSKLLTKADRLEEMIKKKSGSSDSKTGGIRRFFSAIGGMFRKSKTSDSDTENGSEKEESDDECLNSDDSDYEEIQDIEELDSDEKKFIQRVNVPGFEPHEVYAIVEPVPRLRNMLIGKTRAIKRKFTLNSSMILLQELEKGLSWKRFISAGWKSKDFVENNINPMLLRGLCPHRYANELFPGMFQKSHPKVDKLNAIDRFLTSLQPVCEIDAHSNNIRLPIHYQQQQMYAQSNNISSSSYNVPLHSSYLTHQSNHSQQIQYPVVKF